MLLLFIIVGLATNKIVFVKGTNVESIETSLSNKLQTKYTLVYDYKYITLGKFSVVFPKIFNIDYDEIPTFEGSELQIVQQCIDFVNQSSYSKEDSDPNGILTKGSGNCQAMSIMLYTLLKKHGITSSMNLTSDHVYNEVVVNGSTYLVDLAKNIIQKE